VSDKKETTPDPDILRHNLQNAMRAVEGLRNRVKTLEDQLGTLKGASTFLDGACPEKRERFFKALEKMGDGCTVIDCTQKWEPIETAPKDGTNVFLYVPGAVFPQVGRWDGESGRWSQEYTWVSLREATLWMPLAPPPPPPKA
jgi:hypothetical protein